MQTVQKHLALLNFRYDAASSMRGGFGSIPDHIRLNLRHELRPYQEEAIGRFLFYYDEDQSRDQTEPVQLLFNMATGSGKTMIMAALLLDLFRRGYNKIVFFVHTTNIVEKTRENFLDSNSSKYLFADKIVIDGQIVSVREVTDFANVQDDAINVLFTTMAGLHSVLKTPRENSITYDDLADHDLVLLGDEAHHYSGDTKLLTKTELESGLTWERTVSSIMQGNRRNLLLEFTATIDLEDPGILNKYQHRLIYQYDLKAFREDGYSKDVFIYEVAADTMDRAIQAMLISQYRKKVALAAGVWLKPVVMFKSRQINESIAFFTDFKEEIGSLKSEALNNQRTSANGILEHAFSYFDSIGVTTADLAEELKLDFSEERLLSVAATTVTPELQKQLNTLEDPDNEIRAVFAVDVLNEGWDVLNLFDIVRLYDTRDSRNGRVGKTTNAEAQLIGRGARYFPFVVSGGDEDSRYKRKFDNNELESLRIIEQLHYHSAHNPKYIQEIRQALREQGLLPADDVVRRELRLKDSFLKTNTYRTGKIWKNALVEKPPIRPKQGTLFGDEGYNLKPLYHVEIPPNVSRETQVFSPSPAPSTDQLVPFNVLFSTFPKNLVRHAADRNKKIRFDIVSKKIAGIGSLETFLTHETWLGGVKVEVTSHRVTRADALSTQEKLFVVERVLRDIAEDLCLADKEYEGTIEFAPHLIRDLFDKEIVRSYYISKGDAEIGKSQSTKDDFGRPQTNHYLDLSCEDWHAYDDNFGTSEEKKLVLLIRKLIDDLRKKWTDVYLLRNEGAFKIYDFNTGRAFEPDYVLVANDNRDHSVSWQIFLEPKGRHLVEMDKWKENFLLSVNERAEVLGEDDTIKIVGLPFFTTSGANDTSHDIETALLDL